MGQQASSLRGTPILEPMRMGPHMMLGSDNEAVKGAHLQGSAVRRAWGFARPYRAIIIFFLATIVVSAVLDGAVDPTVGETDKALQQIKGFEDSLTTFLAQCSADGSCEFHNGGDASDAYDQLMKSIDESPLPSKDGRPAVSLEVAVAGVGQAMYNSDSWPQLAQALANAQKGDGSGLLALYDDYYARQPDGTYDNLIEAFEVITCMDSTERPTVEEADAEVPEFKAVAPRMAASTAGGYMCTFFPPSIDPGVPITGKGAGPIVVLGTTGDPATPLDGARKMAATLEQGRLVTVVGNRHTGYRVNACSSAAVEDYLVDPVGHLPAEGLRCE